jgi:hypothetical protein
MQVVKKNKQISIQWELVSKDDQSWSSYKKQHLNLKYQTYNNQNNK